MSLIEASLLWKLYFSPNPPTYYNIKHTTNNLKGRDKKADQLGTSGLKEQHHHQSLIYPRQEAEEDGNLEKQMKLDKQQQQNKQEKLALFIRKTRK